MVSKDQAIGGVIFIVCAVIAIGYIVALFFTKEVVDFLKPYIALDVAWVRYWLVTIPVFIAFIAVLCIGAWIGWTMATTPPPKPIEEIEAEEKAEEKPPEEKAEEKPPPPPPEEKKEEKRRRKR